ncbi:meiotic nuclear division 1 family protein [Paenibacillus elgii]|uniref:hypothetical protein n=1 Tax=Paenibacillus elgii TaxID=189691 RepID=UPI0013D04E96|nr:hypothetical protein [Paenibacillus elgii]
MNEGIIEQLATEFSQDALFKLITKMQLTDQLFDEHINELKIGYEYSTTDIERWYCDDDLKPGTMRHWQKELAEYIESSNVGTRRLVRLNYKSVFRLRMALLLREHKVTLEKVAQLVGIRAVDPEVISNKQSQTQSIELSEKETMELDVLKNVVGQMIAFGLVKVENGIPILKINDYIDEAINKRMIMLPNPTEEVNELKEKLESQDKIIEGLRAEQLKSAEQINQRLETLLANAKTDQEWAEYQSIVNELRKNDQLRVDSLNDIMNKLKEDKITTQNEVYDNLPWFVRIFLKKRK